MTSARFEDFVQVINPTRRTNHCWCVNHRLRAQDVRDLGDGDREQAMRTLSASRTPPGVVTYHDGTPVGWCNVGPRAQMPKLVHSSVLTTIDELPVWSIVCLVVRSGHRGQGVTRHLIEGAVAYAASRDAPAIEAYPVDPKGRMDRTMAFVGTRSMFEPLGFEVVGETQAIASRMPRLIMRRSL